ncbi:MAG: nucleotidyltransferase family protein [Akkermansiaceae bacterium]
MKPSWHPTREQEFLLEACLEPDDRAAAALRAWMESVDIQQIDGGSYRLLPLLASRHSTVEAKPKVRALAKGTYRRTWYHNQLLLAEGGKVASLLGAAGIPVMIIKGAALALEYYRDPGARPMDDIDLAVPLEFAGQAVELMVAQGWAASVTPLKGTMSPGRIKGPGWSPGPRAIEAFDGRYFHVRHSHGFRNPKGLGIDLHWHVFQEDCDPDSDADTWAGARPASGGPFPFLVPPAHEHLLLILAHAARWNPIPSIRWVADAATLIKTSPRLEWENFLAAAVRRRRTCAAAELLSYLASRFHAEVPADIIELLAVHPDTKTSRPAYIRDVSRPNLLSGWTEICYLHRRYRSLREISPAACPPGFSRFISGILGAERPSQVMGYAVREGIRRLRGIR